MSNNITGFSRELFKETNFSYDEYSRKLRIKTKKKKSPCYIHEHKIRAIKKIGAKLDISLNELAEKIRLQTNMSYKPTKKGRNALIRKFIFNDKIKGRAKNTQAEFYRTRPWRELRYKALVRCGRRCMCCGAKPTDGIILHVDHVKPRSKFPDLELDINNLQILCEDCNLGKSNLFAHNYRREHGVEDE